MNTGRDGRKRLEGGITVFLSLILTCICALLGGLFESARVAGCGWYMQTALDSSLDSLMSFYHREVWEQYRLFLLEFEDREELAAEAEPYCGAYLAAAPFYPLKDWELTVEEPVRITDAGGDYFEREILDYMKFGIWTEGPDPEAVLELTDMLKEAKSLHEIAEGYQENGRKVLSLEKAIDQIGDCLKKQEKYLREGNEALEDGNGSRFLQAAKHLEKELDRIPGLVEAYEAEADRLKGELERSEAEAEVQKANLKTETWNQIREEMDVYRAYTDEEGERRREVKSVESLAESNRAVAERAVEKAKEIQDYIDSWEPDDEDDELDEEALWHSVLPITAKFQTDTRFSQSKIRDKKKMNLLESISKMAGGDLLAICVPEGTEISGSVVSRRELPSASMSERAGQEENLLKAAAQTALLNEYAAHFFSSFRTEGKREFQYEQEYLLNGAASDRENLKSFVNRFIAAREALNLLFLLGNTEKRSEARTLALAITGASGIAPLAAVTTFFILTVWAFAESVEDAKILLGGGRIPIIKSEREWKISLPGLAESGSKVWSGSAGAPGGSAAAQGRTTQASPGNDPESQGSDSKFQESGRDYQGWLKLFFLLQERREFRYRMMDMIQKNICLKQAGFRMERCAYRLEAGLSGQGPLIPMRRRTGKEY